MPCPGDRQRRPLHTHYITEAADEGGFPVRNRNLRPHALVNRRGCGELRCSAGRTHSEGVLRESAHASKSGSAAQNEGASLLCSALMSELKLRPSNQRKEKTRTLCINRKGCGTQVDSSVAGSEGRSH